MSTALQLSFEVYYLQKGRWSIHARFAADQSEEAVDEAKRLDTGGFEAACVVREAFNPADATSNETVIYHTPTLKTKPPVSRITSDAGSGAGWGPNGPPEGSAAANAIKDAEKRERAFMQKQIAAQEKASAQSEESNEAQDRDWTPDHSRRVARAEKQSDSYLELALKLILVAMISLIFAGGVAYLLTVALNQAAQAGLPIEKNFGQFSIIGAFVLTFSAMFIPLLQRHVRWSEASNPVDQNRTGNAGKASQIVGQRDPDGLSGAPSFNAQEAFAALDEPSLDERIESLNEAEENELAFKTLEELEDDAAFEDYEALLAQEKEIAAELEVLPSALEDEGDVNGLSEELARVDLEVRRVIGGRVDDYTKFGATLFLAGASDALARKFRVASKAASRVLVGFVTALGNSEQMARGFVHNLGEYLVDPKYHQMYERGRSAGHRRLINETAPTGLDEAIADWRKPGGPSSVNDPQPAGESSSGNDEASRENTGENAGQENNVEQLEGKKTAASLKAEASEAERSSTFVAVFFTDIVNSTEQQQANGDEWMMNVIRAHNEIVREGINRFSGREIKHTGDGIMATFPTAASAVEGAIFMQGGFERFRSTMPKNAFEVRVGISAGEPIHESGDIFGTPVNLAARILSKTGASEVCVSSLVKDLCEGKGLQFESIGSFSLKGFPEEQSIFRSSQTPSARRVAA